MPIRNSIKLYYTPIAVIQRGIEPVVHETNSDPYMHNIIILYGVYLESEHLSFNKTHY